MIDANPEADLDKKYHVSWYIIVYKLVLGLIEFSSGIVIGLFRKKVEQIYWIHLTQELSEDPHDLLARLSEQVVPQLLARHTFLGIYLIVLGAAKIAGSIGLLFGKNWGVDLLVGLTLFMLPFQLIHLILNPSVFDSVIISFGLVIALYLIEFKPKAWISRLSLKASRRFGRAGK